MFEITLIQDLARKKLCEVPRNLLSMTNLKMLYLEGNDLVEIPSEMFILLDKLQWLDVRNNKLTYLPKSVMDHMCLETILLQNNNIEALPLELAEIPEEATSTYNKLIPSNVIQGFVPNLKVLQLSGNPLMYPKKSIIESGVHGIKTFLRNEYIAKEQHQEKDESEIESEKEKNYKENDKHSRINEKFASKPSMPVITLKSFHRIPKNKKSRSKNKAITYKNRSKYNIYKDTPYSNSSKYINSSPMINNEQKIKDHIIKDVFMKNMQEMMILQEEKIQEQRQHETMKNWRYNSKYRCKTANASYRPTAPFDYNNEYDKIPTRKELNQFLTKSSESMGRPANKPKNTNVEKLINDIVESLKCMEKERNIAKTPRTQMDYAGREIKRILDLQKRLSALKITNDRHL